MLIIENLSLKFNGVNILNDINLVFGEGEVVGIKGQNGSGKSMFLKVICGLIPPTTGSILYGDLKIGPNHNLLPKCGVLIDKPGLLPHLSGYDNLLYYSKAFKQAITVEEIKYNMEKFNLDIKDKRPVRKYSMGMKQKLGILQAFIGNPSILILDEPINNLEYETIGILYEMIRDLNNKFGTLVIITSHMESAIDELYQRDILITNGSVAKDMKRTMEDIKNVSAN